MVHAITKHGSLVAFGVNSFSIPEYFFKPKDDGEGKKGKGVMGTDNTAEMF